jgi:HlyD family secretion protein
MAVKTTRAGYAEARAKLDVAAQQVKVGEANVATIQSRVRDATLTSPVLGRVLYRLAEPGEVLGPGGKALTLVNLEDVYLELFLPSEQAAAVKLGAEARFTVDYEPNRVAPGHVSFVSPEAQFTPKEVETRSEREKLMFRVKIQVSRAIVLHYIDRIKTGVRGVGYVKVSDSAVWPDWLQNNLVTPNEPDRNRPNPPVSAIPSPTSTSILRETLR